MAVTAYDASLTQLLSELADGVKINLLIVGRVESCITLRLRNRTVGEALSDIALMTGNTYRRVEDIHFFGKSAVQPDQINPLLEQKIIWLKHLDAQELPLMLPVDISEQNLIFAPDHNAVILLGTAEMIQDVEQIIASLDVADDAIRTRQQWAIAIEVDQDTELLTVDVKDAAIERVIREIAIRTGINMLILGEGESRPSAPRNRRAVRTRRNPSTTQNTQIQQTQSQAVQQISRGLVRVGLRNTVQSVSGRCHAESCLSRAAERDRLHLQSRETRWNGSLHCWHRRVDGRRD